MPQRLLGVTAHELERQSDQLVQTRIVGVDVEPGIDLESDIEAADGDWAPMGIIVVEFESSEASRKWYNSPEYQAVIGQRLSSTDSNTVFMDVE